MNVKVIHSIKSKLILTIKLLFSRQEIDYLLLALFGLYIFAVWFEGDALYFGGDIVYPLKPSLNIDRLLYTWTDANGGMMESGMMYYFVYGFFFITDKMGIPLGMAERIYLYIEFILPGLAMYYLTSVIYLKIYPNSDRKRIACWIAALFYMFCPAILKFSQVYWYYAVFPFVLAFFIKTVDAPEIKGKIKYSLLAALFCFGFLLFFPNGQMALILVLILVLYSVFYLLFSRRKVKQLLKSWLVFGIVVILINLGVTLPWLLMVSGQGTEVLAQHPLTSGSGRWMDEGSHAMLRNLTLTFGMGPEGGRYLPTGFYFGPYGPGTVVHVANLLLTIAAFGALLLKRSKMLLYFAIVALIGIVISQGPNPPFGEGYKWLVQNVLILRVFRTVGQVNTIIALGYAVLIGITISEVCRRVREQLYPRAKKYLHGAGEKAVKHVMPATIVALVTGLILINGWPMVNGAFFKTPGQWPNNQLQEVPSSYYELDSWLSEQDNSRNNRLLTLPVVYGYQALQWPSSDIYTGAVMPYISSTPVVFSYTGREGTTAPVARLVYDAVEYDYRLMARLAGLLNVKYYYVDGYDYSSWGLSGILFAGKLEQLPPIDNAVVIYSSTMEQPVSGYALEFDGEGDYVEVADSPSIYSNTSTVEAWVKSYVANPQYIDCVPIAVKRGDGDEYRLFLYYGTVAVDMWTNEGGFSLNTETKITDTNWHHIAFTTDGNTIKTYLDGELQGSTDYTGEVGDTSSAIYIGREPAMARYFNGAIDEVRILNRALNDNEIEASYDRKQAQDEDGVVALWHFEEGSGNTALDDSYHHNDGTIYGAEYIGYPEGANIVWAASRDWSIYGGSGSFRYDEDGLTISLPIDSQGFAIHLSFDLDYHSYPYLIVRVKGDANIKFAIALKRAVYEPREIMYMTSNSVCGSDFTTYVFELLPYRIQYPEEEVKYITLAAEKSSGQEGEACFAEVIFAQDVDQLLEEIGEYANYHYVQSFDRLGVYSIDDEWVFPRVYATSEIHAIEGSTETGLLDFLETADFADGKPVLFVQEQLSSQDWDFVSQLNSGGNSPQITFEQLNPTKYVAHISNSSGEPFFIVLSTQFDRYWIATIDGKEVSGHLMANGYANAWYIDKTGTYDIVLYFKPQSWYYIGLVVSGVAFAGFASYPGWSWILGRILNRRKKNIRKL